MKSTYDLLSIYLDNQALPKFMPQLINISEVPECLEMDEDYSLFDLPICRRKISGLKMLSSLSAKETEILVGKVADIREIIVILDFNSISVTACRLYLKRILQAVNLLTEIYPTLDITLAGDNQEWFHLLTQISIPIKAPNATE